MKRWASKWIPISILSLFWLAGCKPKKEALGEFKIKNARHLAKEVASARSVFSWYSTKARMKFKGARSFSGTATIKIRRDSIFWSSVSPGFGLEAARAQVRSDSAMYLNRLSRTYATYPNQELRRLTGIENLGLPQLQEIFSGNPPFKVGAKPEIKVGKGKLAIVSEEDGVYYEAWLRPDNYKLDQLVLRHQASQKVAEISFGKYIKTTKGWLPGFISVSVPGDSPMNIEFSTNRIDVENSQRMSFSVPSTYGRQE